MTITRNFKLCLNAGVGLAPYINVNQFDQGEQWVFTLYNEDGTQYTPSTGAIVGIKADHFGIINTGTVVDGKVVINETQQMTAAAGKAIFELQIDGDTHGTANFIVMVEPKPGNNADYSDSDISGIQQAIDAANLINELADAGEEPKQFIIDEVDAWLDNHPEATTTVLDGAITAPKINNSLWDKLLVSESASGAVASFDDGADDVPVSSLKVALEPIQTGTGDPSPTNVRPIYPANGKNLFDLDGWLTTLNVPYTKDGDTYTILPTDTPVYSTPFVFSETDIPVTKTTAVTIPSGSLATNIGFELLNSNNTVVGGRTDSATGNACKIRINWSTSGAFTVTKPMIRLSSITDSYQPYQGIMLERTGKNQLQVVKYSTANYTPFSNNIQVVANENNQSLTLTCVGSGQTCLLFNHGYPHGTYAISYEVTNYDKRSIIRCFDAENNILTNETVTIEHATWNNFYKGFYFGDGTFTVPETVDHFWVGIGVFGDTTGDTITLSKIQLEAGSEVTSYEPYTGTSYPYTLGQTVYGGSVDLATGVLTVDKGFIVLDGSNDESYTVTAVGSNARFGITVSDAGRVWSTNLVDGKANYLITKNDVAYAATGNAFAIDGNSLLIFCILGVTTVENLRTYLAAKPLEISYPLKNPQTIQLTPQEVKTLLGYNNISSSGTVEVIYHADTKLYVDKMTNVDNSVIAPTEESFTATRNYTTNDLVIVADTLYKVTSNIATGSAITPNSNVQQTTLSALIKALS